MTEGDKQLWVFGGLLAGAVVVGVLVKPKNKKKNGTVERSGRRRAGRRSRGRAFPK